MGGLFKPMEFTITAFIFLGIYVVSPFECCCYMCVYVKLGKYLNKEITYGELCSGGACL